MLITYEIKKYILAGNRVWGADITADEKELIVTNGNSDDISIIDLTDSYRKRYSYRKNTTYCKNYEII